MENDGMIVKFFYKVLIMFISLVFCLSVYANDFHIETKIELKNSGILSILDSAEKDNMKIIEQFRLAVSYSQLEQYSEAIELFENITKEENEQLVESANWYLGICYLKIEATHKAIKQFKKIVKEENSYSKAAESILLNLQNK